MVLVALTVGSVAVAAENPASGTPTPTATATWSGFYLGGHFGYTAGRSDWTAIGAAGPPVRDSLNLFNGYDAFKGTGSFFSGLQAGYSHIFLSRLVLGAGADISFPNTFGGRPIIPSPLIVPARYGK